MIFKLADTLPHKGYHIGAAAPLLSVSTALGAHRRGHYMYGMLDKECGDIPSEVIAALEASGAEGELGEGGCRWRMAPILAEKKVPSKLAKGETEPAPELIPQEKVGAIAVGIWRDVSADNVFYLSTCHEPKLQAIKRSKKAPLGAKSRPQEVKVDAPTALAEFFKKMGEEAGGHQISEHFKPVLVHQRRWYQSLIYYIFKLLLENSLVVYNEQASALSLEEYRNTAIQWLRSKALPRPVEPPKKRRRLAGFEELPANRLCGSARDHLLEKVPVRMRRACRLCYTVDKKQQNSSYKCQQCDAFLHLPDCWNRWHCGE